MSRYVTDDSHSLTEALMFASFGNTPVERFLREELVRYVPQMVGLPEQQIADFIRYQRAVYLDGCMPMIGTPVASFNPMFTDSVDGVAFKEPGLQIRHRVSVKENGYRMQVHRGHAHLSAYSRQFTPFDLRMFPELTGTFKSLPLMIGDTELANLHHMHLAGFNRVEKRIPNQTCWPRKGETKLSDQFIGKYLADTELFEEGEPLLGLELTLAFHGLFSIAHPKTWDKSRALQMENMISLCRLPIDHEKVDELLGELGEFIARRGLNARVAERFVPETPTELKRFVQAKEKEGYEGVCIVTSARNDAGELQPVNHAIKVKKYETFDTALLGLHLKDEAAGLVPDNVAGAMLGLFDQYLGVYLPAVKVNLDPAGRQVKTDGQRARLKQLRSDLTVAVIEKSASKERGVIAPSILTLHDVFLLQGAIKLGFLLKDYPSTAHPFKEILERIPRGKDLAALYDMFVERGNEIQEKPSNRTTQSAQFIHRYWEFFWRVSQLDANRLKSFKDYFSRSSEIKSVSARLVKPNHIVSTVVPIVVEAHVFDIKWGASPFAAGFHSWYGNAFCFSNAYAERIRHDKINTTPYDTVFIFARRYTAKKARKHTSRSA